jgi:hypothetical protein
MNMMKLAVAISLALSVGACGGKGGGGGNSNEGAGTINGLVTDVGTGARLAGVTVSGGGKSATTDAQGEFSLKELPSGPVKLSLEKDGYAPGYTTSQVSDSATAALVSLKKAGRLQAYNPSATATLVEQTEAGPYAVILSPNSLDTTATSLRVSVTPLDPTKEHSSLPGELTSGGASPTLLVPLTFAEFTILDPSGTKVNLRANSSAIVELPIPPALRPQYPLGRTVHCYAYNPNTGKWEDFVEGNVVVSSVDHITPVLKASVRHFSWYGGAPQGNNCVQVAGRVVSAVDGRPLPNARVEAFPGTSTYTDANGIFSVLSLDGANTTFAAARTYYLSQDTDVGGVRLPAGAKVIEFGKIDYTLQGLVRVPCSGGSGMLATNEYALGSPGDRDNPIVVRVGTISRLSYDAFGVLDASQGSSANVYLMLESGIRGANGDLEQLRQPASGGRVWLTTPSGQRVDLTEVVANSGMYIASNAPITAGQSYTISIDPDGTGTVKGSGSIFAVGSIAWRNPTRGAHLPASNLRVQWTDSGTGGGNQNYAGFYLVYLVGGGDSAVYYGGDRQFDARSAATGGTLRPGSYTGSIWGVSGPFVPGTGGFPAPTNNITGPDVSGKFYSLSSAPVIDFTLQ